MADDEMEGIEVLDDGIVNRMVEVGTSGVMIVRGELFNNEDYVPELRGDSAMAKYEEMWYSDGQIEGALFHLRSPMVAGKWVAKPATSEVDEDGNPVSSKLDLEVAEYITKWTIDADPLGDGTGWPGFVEHTVSHMDVFGFMPYEKSWGVTKDGDQVIAKYCPRDPKSVTRFHLKQGGDIESMEQWSYGVDGHAKRIIKGERLVPFTFRKRGDNWFGRSILRHCYLPWNIWRQLAVIDAMRHERHGMGIPVLELPPGAGKSSIEQAKKVVKELRAHERQYVKLPPGFKLTWYFPSGSGTDIIGSMKYWDDIKARSLMNELMALGSGNTGGTRSLGETKQKAALLAVQGHSMLFASVMKKYAIGPMVNRKFGDGVPIPTLEIEDLDSLDVTGLANALKALRDGDFIEPDDPLEDYLRSKIKVTAKQLSTVRKKAPPIDPFAKANGEDEGKPAGEFRFRPGRKFKLAREGNTPIILVEREQPRTFTLSREPFEHEKACAFEEMASWFDNEPARAFVDEVKPVRDQQMKDIVAIVLAADVKDLSKHTTLKRPKVDKLANVTFGVLKPSYMNGRKSIKDEYNKQKDGAAPSRPDTTVTAAVADLLKPATEELARVRRLAESFAEEVTETMVESAAQVALRARLLGLAEQAIEERVFEALTSISEARITQTLAGEVIASFTFGRNDAMQRVDSEIETTFYSAIMDSGTCEPCAELDGQEHEFGDEAFVTPNPNCDYPPHCRCVTIPVFKRD